MDGINIDIASSAYYLSLEDVKVGFSYTEKVYLDPELKAKADVLYTEPTIGGALPIFYLDSGYVIDEDSLGVIYRTGLLLEEPEPIVHRSVIYPHRLFIQPSDDLLDMNFTLWGGSRFLTSRDLTDELLLKIHNPFGISTEIPHGTPLAYITLVNTPSIQYVST